MFNIFKMDVRRSKQMKLWTRGPIGSASMFGVIHCKSSNVKVFKRLLLLHFSSNFNQTLQKTFIRGKYRLFLFLGICQISIKLFWFHLAKGQAEGVNMHGTIHMGETRRTTSRLKGHSRFIPKKYHVYC